MKTFQFIDKLANLVVAGKERQAADLSRRVWVQNLGVVSATGAVRWACGGGDDDKASADGPTEDPAADAAIVKVALDLEDEAIALYTAAAGLPIWTAATDPAQKALDQAVLAIAASFL